MRNIAKNKDRVYIIIVLAVLIGILTFLQPDKTEYSYQISILERSAIYAMVAASINLLAGFTGLFSLGQAGPTVVGVYVVAIFAIPVGPRAGVYYVNGIPPAIASVQLPIPVALLFGGPAIAGLAALIRIPVLCLKNDYPATMILEFSEIIRVFITAPVLGTITNGSYDLRSISGSPNIFVVFGLTALCIGLMMLPIDSSYGRILESIRGDEIVTQSMGVNLFHYKGLPFVISSFFADAGGGMLAVFTRSTDSKTFQVVFTYGILLIVVLGGIGSVTGSVSGSFVVTTGREALRFFDDPLTIAGIHVPLLRPDFRMVIFFILLMAVVLFYSRDIMRNRRFSREGLFRLIGGIPYKLKGRKKKASASKEGGVQ